MSGRRNPKPSILLLVEDPELYFKMEEKRLGFHLRKTKPKETKAKRKPR